MTDERPDLLKELVQPADEPREGEPSVVYAQEQVSWLVLRDKFEIMYTLPYGSLNLIRFIPSFLPGKEDEISLAFASATIKVTGRYLKKVYYALNDQTVRAVWVASRDAIAEFDNSTVAIVHSIFVDEHATWPVSTTESIPTEDKGN
jgi:hypothetical protein